MPKISEIIDQKDKKKKFTRKEYRPWNLSETLSSDNKEPKQVKQTIEVEPAQDITKKINISEKKYAVPEKQEEHIKENQVKQLESKEVFTQHAYSKPEILISSEDLLIQLSGRQKELFILVLRNLIDNKSLITTPMYSKDLIESINTSIGTIKNAVRRLESKGLIKSVSKRARGGHFRFEVSEEIISIGQRLLFRL